MEPNCGTLLLTSEKARSSFWTISYLQASIKAIKKMIKSPIRPQSKIIQFNNFIDATLVGFSVTTEFWKRFWRKYGKKNQWEYFCISCPALPYPKTAPCRPIPGSRLVGKFTKAVGRKKRNNSWLYLAIFHYWTNIFVIKPPVKTALWSAASDAWLSSLSDRCSKYGKDIE